MTNAELIAKVRLWEKLGGGQAAQVLGGWVLGLAGRLEEADKELAELKEARKHDHQYICAKHNCCACGECVDDLRKAERERDEARTVLSAWQSVFKSQSLDHAHSNYNAALEKAAQAQASAGELAGALELLDKWEDGEMADYDGDYVLDVVVPKAREALTRYKSSPKSALEERIAEAERRGEAKAAERLGKALVSGMTELAQQIEFPPRPEPKKEEKE